MKRHLLNPATALSLLLFAAVAALWAGSYRVSQFVGWSDPSCFLGALSMQGLVRLEYGTYPGDHPGWSHVSYPTPRGADLGLWREVRIPDRRGGPLKRLGVAWSRTDYDFDGKRLRRALYLPHWLPACILAAAPARRIGRALRHRRRKTAGLCPRCGYNLTGNTSGVCPECGGGIT